jgi:hypothetical protein
MGEGKKYSYLDWKTLEDLAAAAVSRDGFVFGDGCIGLDGNVGLGVLGGLVTGRIQFDNLDSLTSPFRGAHEDQIIFIICINLLVARSYCLSGSTFTWNISIEMCCHPTLESGSKRASRPGKPFGRHDGGRRSVGYYGAK